MSDKKDLRITSTYWKQIQILRHLKYICKQYLEERWYILYRSRASSLLFCDSDKAIEYMRDSTRFFAEKHYNEVLSILKTYDLPLLQSWWYSGLKALINEVIEDSWMKDWIAYKEIKEKKE